MEAYLEAYGSIWWKPWSLLEPIMLTFAPDDAHMPKIIRLILLQTESLLYTQPQPSWLPLQLT